MRLEKVGRVKIGKSKAKEYEYPYLRLPTELSNWIGKKTFVYRVSIDGHEGILLGGEEFEQLLTKFAQNLDKNNEVVQQSKIEERLNKLENMFYQLYDVVMKKEANPNENRYNSTAPGVGFEPTRAEPNGLAGHRENNDPVVEYRITLEMFEEWLKVREAQGLRPSYLKENRNVVRKFLNDCGWVITKENVLDYIKHLQRLKRRERNANRIIDFLEYLQDVYKFDFSVIISLFKRVEDPKEEKQLFAEEDEEEYTLTLEDIHKGIDELIEMHRKNHVGLLRDISLVVFMASTGIRPIEATSQLGKQTISRSMIDLNQDFFKLEAEITKTKATRVIPLHPDTKWILQRYFVFVNDPDKPLWFYETVRKTIGKTAIKNLERFRKFFTKLAKSVNFDQLKRVAIQGHDEGELLKLKVTKEFYERYTPQEITKEYLEKIGKIQFLTDEHKRKIEEVCKR
ncbi:hypothetical protein DRP07_00645 [Archaeoglobales archaeon]|nr:MAG: hypothetical protein DRP07_00645 [Archaeoglobales archaeon]